MKPIAVIPFNDPNGVVLPHLKTAVPALKSTFAKVFGSVTAETPKELVHPFKSDPFFGLTFHDKPLPVGDDFLGLYAKAAESCQPDQILHLCFPDRVAFALLTAYRNDFVADINAVTSESVPFVFTRSATAWATHPQNYHEFEQMMTRAAEHLLDKTLDFAWCHLVLQAQQLLEILPKVKNRDISFVAELVLAVRDDVSSKEVDWLSWEDPFILGVDASELKLERERSVAEAQKRLNYVIPILQLIRDAAIGGNN